MLPAAVTPATQEALDLVRDPALFKWYAVFFLLVVMYIYANEIERGRWDIVSAGLAVLLADIFNETMNGVIAHASDHAPLWATTGPTAYQLLVGLNLEIAFMFSIAGIVYAKLLPADRSMKILGIPNRLAVALGLSLLAIVVEVLLNDMDVLRWEYWWWNFPFLPLVFVFGYLWFFLFAWFVFDRPTQARRWQALGVLAAIDLALIGVFGPILGWL